MQAMLQADSLTVARCMSAKAVANSLLLLLPEARVALEH